MKKIIVLMALVSSFIFMGTTAQAFDLPIAMQGKVLDIKDEYKTKKQKLEFAYDTAKQKITYTMKKVSLGIKAQMKLAKPDYVKVKSHVEQYQKLRRDEVALKEKYAMDSIMLKKEYNKTMVTLENNWLATLKK